MGPLAILQQLIAQMGLLLLRERVVRGVFENTALYLAIKAEKADNVLLANNLRIAAKAWHVADIPESK